MSHQVEMLPSFLMFPDYDMCNTCVYVEYLCIFIISTMRRLRLLVKLHFFCFQVQCQNLYSAEKVIQI